MRKTNDRGEQAGRFAYEGLDRVLHEKARLGILASLVAAPEGLRFSELRGLCSLTPGNLGQHIEVLREAGVVEVWKGFENRRPQTLCRLTTPGRQQFVTYLQELQRVVADTMSKASKSSGPPPGLPRGWQRVSPGAKRQ